ncbi:MAG: hypothetical protein ACLFTA_03665 [Candidatus Nanohaloarchaea archaeon]
MGWEDVRDWEVNEAIIDLQHDSYDVVARDLTLRDGVRPDLFRYRHQNFLVEAGFFYLGENMRQEAMADLEDVRRVLSDSSFTHRLYLKDADAVRPNYTVELEGNYLFSPDSDVEAVKTSLEDILDETFDSKGLSSIRCKR